MAQYVTDRREKVLCNELLRYPLSKFKFSFVVPIRFQLKVWKEFVEVSVRLILRDHVLSSHDHCVL